MEDDEADLKGRRDRLAAQLQARQPKPGPSPARADASAASAWSLGVKAGSEFIAAVIVGGAMGWGLDYVAHSRPLFTIVFFLLGVVAGIWNVIRATTPKGGV